MARWLLYQRPLISELIIGMVGFLLMKHNLLSATHQPTVHQALATVYKYILSSVIWGISWKFGTNKRKSTQQHFLQCLHGLWVYTCHSWLVPPSQIFMRLCTQIVHTNTQSHSWALLLSQKLRSGFYRTTHIQFVCKQTKSCACKQ